MSEEAVYCLMVHSRKARRWDHATALRASADHTLIIVIKIRWGT